MQTEVKAKPLSMSGASSDVGIEWNCGCEYGRAVYNMRGKLTSGNKLLHQRLAGNFAVGELRSFVRLYIAVSSVGSDLEHGLHVPIISYSESECLPPGGSGLDLGYEAKFSCPILRHPCLRWRHC